MPSYGGLIPSSSVQALLQLHKPYPCAFMIVERQRIDKARNNIVMEAIKNRADYVLFVDDDNPIPPDTLEKFVEDDKDIVIAPILGRNPDTGGKHPLCAFYKKEVIVDNDKLNIYFNIDKFNDNGPLHKIDAGGTGCMLIKTKVLIALYAKYKDLIFEFGDIRFKKSIEIEGAIYDRRTMSEDCEFCERATNMGFEIWLDDRIKPFHITTYNLIQWRE